MATKIPEAGAWSFVEPPAGLGDDRVGVLRFDLPGREVNLLTPQTLDELEARLREVGERGYRGLVITSGKPGSFVAGVDIDVMAAIESAEEGSAAAARGQAVLRLLAELGVPTVAAVHGACVGGGAELAAWCTQRVLTADDRTRAGFPEVRLGIVPGFGGTQRLPHLVGLGSALDLTTSGRLLSARQALAIGFADAVVHPDYLLLEAAARAREGGASRRRRWRPSSWPVVRGVVTAVAARRVRAAAGGRYPAPAEAVRLCRLALRVPLDAGLGDEASTVGRLLAGQVARSLLHVHACTRRDRAAGQAPPERALLGVVGAGVMGSGIAGLSAARGHRARLTDVDLQALGKGVAGAARVMDRALRRAVDRRLAVQSARDRLSHALGVSGLEDADAVVEAVVEREDVKREVLARLEDVVADDALLATNTSSLSVARLAEDLRHPERFLGLHFFNPVPRMPLVEVIPGPQTSSGAVERAVGWARALGKHVVLVADTPGFLVNRVLMPYLDEAQRLEAEGVPIRAVDRAAEAFGMPMGPFRLLDEVGLDVAAKVAETFRSAFPGRFGEAEALERLVRQGRLGRKTGRGFYVHGRRGRRARPAERGHAARALEAAEIQDRLFLRMADEGLRCLEEGVARSAADVDLATVMGIGFPAHLGGPCRWIQDAGPAALLQRLEALHGARGERFAPSRRFRNVAAGKDLHPRG